MPSHSERVRRNYPEGVPQFGTRLIATVNMGDGRTYDINAYPVPPIDYSDIPALSETQLAAMRHVPYEDSFTIRPDAQNVNEISHTCVRCDGPIKGAFIVLRGYSGHFHAECAARLEYLG